MDNVLYLNEVKAGEKHNEALAKAFDEEYGFEPKVKLTYRLPKGEKNVRKYLETITEFSHKGKAAYIHEYVKEPNGMTDFVELFYEGTSARYKTYVEAERALALLLK